MTEQQVTFALSVIAIVVSMATAVAAYRQGSRQGKIQERLLALESVRERDRKTEASSARVQASISHIGSNYRLYLANVGSSEARMISIRLDGKPIMKHDLIPQGATEITRLGSGASTSYPLGVHNGTDPKVEIEIQWEDSSGNPGSWSTELNVFG